MQPRLYRWTNRAFPRETASVSETCTACVTSTPTTHHYHKGTLGRRTAVSRNSSPAAKVRQGVGIGITGWCLDARPDFQTSRLWQDATISLQRVGLLGRFRVPDGGGLWGCHFLPWVKSVTESLAAKGGGNRPLWCERRGKEAAGTVVLVSCRRQ